MLSTEDVARIKSGLTDIATILEEGASHLRKEAEAINAHTDLVRVLAKLYSVLDGLQIGLNKIGGADG